MFNYRCPQCRTTLRLPNEYIRLSGTCNHCHSHITITIEERVLVTRAKNEPFGEYLKKWLSVHWSEK